MKTVMLKCGCSITRSMFEDNKIFAVTPCIEHVESKVVQIFLDSLWKVLSGEYDS